MEHKFQISSILEFFFEIELGRQHEAAGGRAAAKAAYSMFRGHNASWPVPEASADVLAIGAVALLNYGARRLPWQSTMGSDIA